MRLDLTAAMCLVIGACGNDAGLKIHEDPPTATLMEPGDSDTFIAGSAVAFRVQLDDSDDGVSSLDLQWRSDTLGTLRGDGELDGKVHTFVTSELEIGVHVVSITATDPDGHVATDDVEINIIANQPPMIAITSPEEGQAFGEFDTITVAVQANDTEEDVEALRLNWSMNGAPVADAPDRPDIDGSSTHAFNALAAGEHTITVDATDTLGEASQDQITIRVVALDGDGDGFNTDELGGEDCDDTDPEVGPGADEVCDGIDNDCDGLIDADDPDILDAFAGYPDLDGDGYGDETTIILTCDLDDLSETGGDCNDHDEDMNPGAFEICDDGLDNDCDGTAGACSWSGEVSVETADHTSWGNEPNDGIASAFGTGDLTGDGITDLVIGARYADTVEQDAGGVYVIAGPLLMSAGTLDSHTGAAIEGEMLDDFTGTAVGVADIDGDGTSDLFIGSPGADPVGSGRNAGELHMIYGPVTDDRNIDDSDAYFHGASEDNALGASAPNHGDLDGDGLPDLVMGATGIETHVAEGGGVYIFMGQTTRWAGANSIDDRDTEILSNSSGMRFGEVVTFVGDVNSDGRDDLLVGAPRGREHGIDTGAAYLILGHATNFTIGASRLHSSANATYNGDDTRDKAGTSLAGLGDVDGDGYDEFAIGAPFNDIAESNSGTTYLMLTPALSGTHSLEDAADVVLRGADSGDNSGTSIAGNTDLNNDGILDLVVGSPGASVSGVSSGGAYLLYGPIADLEDGLLGGSDGLEDAVFVGANMSDYAGRNMISGADWSDDGIDDLAIGSPGHLSDAGGVHVFFGRGM